MTRRVLVLGAYGFIGHAVAHALTAAGHVVVGLGRDPTKARAVGTVATWHIADLVDLPDAGGWDRLLDGIDVVVNAAGALQTGARDDLDRVHDRAIAGLVEACARTSVERLVQISAPGATGAAATAFGRTKARGDAHVRAGAGEWIILRPGLVIGAHAYGGSALLRALAAFPLVQPLVLGDRPVQTVALDDVARIVVAAVNGDLPAGSDLDLVEPATRPLGEVVAAVRAWLGFRAAWHRLDLPRGVGVMVGVIADGLGHLGWRSPLRTTALRVLDDGIRGDPAPLAALTGKPLRTLEETLASLPSTAQERRFARDALVMPLVIAVLAVFWAGTGIVTLLDPGAAADVLAGTIAQRFAPELATAGALVDVALGLAVLVRRFARAACLAMAAVTLLYLALGSILVPSLWLDPLGPLLKAVPALVLALVAAGWLDER